MGEWGLDARTPSYNGLAARGCCSNQQNSAPAQLHPSDTTTKCIKRELTNCLIAGDSSTEQQWRCRGGRADGDDALGAARGAGVLLLLLCVCVFSRGVFFCTRSCLPAHDTAKREATPCVCVCERTRCWRIARHGGTPPASAAALSCAVRAGATTRPLRRWACCAELLSQTPSLPYPTLNRAGRRARPPVPRRGRVDPRHGARGARAARGELTREAGGCGGMRTRLHKLSSVRPLIVSHNFLSHVSHHHSPPHAHTHKRHRRSRPRS